MNPSSAGSTSITELPRAPGLARLGVFGATAIFTALAIGSGELMFWPALVLSGGAGVLWLAIVIVLLQWVINIEVARYSLATGEAMGEGAAARSRWLGLLLLLGAIVPWIWPGWVRSGGQLLAGLSGLPEMPISLVSILLCALLLSAPPVIYPWVEKAQSLMLAIILVGVVVLFAQIAATSGGLSLFVNEFFGVRGASAAGLKFAAAKDSDYYALLGGVVFAGAGGILNLGYGLLVAEKGFGMGAYRPRLRGITMLGNVDEAPAKVEMADTPANVSEWRRWMRLTRSEHGLLFAGGNILSIIFLSAIFFMVFRNASAETSGVSLLVDTYARLGALYGSWAAILFGVVGFLVFFTSALGILHVTSRIAAGIAAVLFGGITNKWFHIFVWGQYLASSILILLDPRQPFWLLVTSAVLNTAVMAVYAYAILWLNRRALPPFARASLGLELLVAVAGTCYGLLFAWTVGKLAFGL